LRLRLRLRLRLKEKEKGRKGDREIGRRGNINPWSQW
jgi:hypothetical protein